MVPTYFVRGLGWRLRWAHAQLLGGGLLRGNWTPLRSLPDCQLRYGLPAVDRNWNSFRDYLRDPRAAHSVVRG